ncbi:metal ABC transporter ATP-binding protein [Desulfobacter curvatus]|uniref:metal ABC transporter ATP-binding protein n=1 Tax=Desulfobacter curvatus TaxID=2290 RepID=UPI00037BC76B|nr:ABC transporter ATP-binding protein [Desulfobacter curvatus]
MDFSYNGENVLSDINLTIREHDFIAVIGPNGGGKSTLIRLILGLLKPDKGKIRVLGERPGKHSQDLGYVPQNVHINDHFPITALDVVLMGCLGTGGRFGQSGRSRKECERDGLATLERLGMAKHARKKIGELSGGQRQRVFIARSLMTQPRLLFLDEPTASIDSRGQEEFLNLLEILNKDVAIVVVTHDLFAVSGYVKSVACVNHGLHYHSQEEIKGQMLETMYECSVEDVCRVQVLAQVMPGAPGHKTAGGADGNP